MAQVVLGPNGYDMSVPGAFISGSPIYADSTTFIALLSDGSRATYTGSFTYPDGNTVSGTITGFLTETFDGSQWVMQANVTGLSLAVSTYLAFSANNDWNGLVTSVLSGDDFLIGNGGNDLFRGYGGNNQFFGSGGYDTVDYAYDFTARTIDVNSQTAVTSDGKVDTFSGVESVRGSLGNDVFVTDGAVAYAVDGGGQGDDTLVFSGVAKSAATLAYTSNGIVTITVGGVVNGAVVSSGGELQAYGAVSGDTIRSGGAVYVFSGGTVGGTTLDGGFLEILSGGTAGISQIGFTSAGGTLQLDDSVHFNGVISGFDQGGIDLRDIAFGSGTTLGYTDFGTSGTLTVSDGTHTASLHLLGQYVEANFTKQSDGAGGTLITDPPVTLDALTLTGSPRTV
jgi:autotransporter passenger strand-loop-strand repeat protein